MTDTKEPTEQTLTALIEATKADSTFVTMTRAEAASLIDGFRHQPPAKESSAEALDHLREILRLASGTLTAEMDRLPQYRCDGNVERAHQILDAAKAAMNTLQQGRK